MNAARANQAPRPEFSQEDLRQLFDRVTAAAESPYGTEDEKHGAVVHEGSVVADDIVQWPSFPAYGSPLVGIQAKKVEARQLNTTSDIFVWEIGGQGIIIDLHRDNNTGHIAVLAFNAFEKRNGWTTETRRIEDPLQAAMTRVYADYLLQIMDDLARQQEFA